MDELDSNIIKQLIIILISLMLLVCVVDIGLFNNNNKSPMLTALSIEKEDIFEDFNNKQLKGIQVKRSINLLEKDTSICVCLKANKSSYYNYGKEVDSDVEIEGDKILPSNLDIMYNKDELSYIDDSYVFKSNLIYDIENNIVGIYLEQV